MLRIGLILSNDWEVFGNGRGDFHTIQYEPTNKLIELCERHGAKLTLMAEIGQQWAHEKLGRQHGWAGDIAASWKTQAKGAITAGHDVQLHLHPQWINATHDGENWSLDYSRYSLTSFSADDSVNTINSAREYLEQLLSEADENYQCVAFRAGNFMVDPSDKYIRCITAAGIKYDTTVCKGQYLKNSFGSYDFRGAESACLPWRVSEKSLNRADGDRRNLVEFPILSEPYAESRAGRRVLSKLGWSGNQLELLRGGPVYRIAQERFKLSSASYRRHQELLAQRRTRYPGGGLPARRNLGQTVARYGDYIWRRSSLMLDYDNLMPEIAAAMVVNCYEKLAARNVDGYVPITAIGHVKNMINTEYVDEFLTFVTSELGDAMSFQTLTEACAAWSSSPAPQDNVRY